MALLELALKEGDKALPFTATTNGGQVTSLADYGGKHVILYFYPKDDTPGCTKEACGFRDSWKDFEKKGATVLGVSVDSVKKHDKFVEKYSLPFTLLADEDKKNCSGLRRLGTQKVYGTEIHGYPSGYFSDRSRWDC